MINIKKLNKTCEKIIYKDINNNIYNSKIKFNYFKLLENKKQLYINYKNFKNMIKQKNRKI